MLDSILTGFVLMGTALFVLPFALYLAAGAFFACTAAVLSSLAWTLDKLAALVPIPKELR